MLQGSLFQQILSSHNETLCLKSVPVECFLLTYDLTDFKSRINRQILTVGSFKTFPVCFNIFVLLCLVTPCLLVAVQLCME